MSSVLSVDLDFFRSKEWNEKRVFSRAEALLHIQFLLASEGQVLVTLRSLSDKFSWGMSRTERLVIWLKTKYQVSQDGRYILKKQHTESTVLKLFTEDDHPNDKKGVTFKAQSEYFIKEFNVRKGSKEKPTLYKLTDKVKRHLRARIKEGYNSNQIFTALRNALKDEYHVNQEPPLKYVTPEYILRSDVLERYCNMTESIKANLRNAPLTNAQKRRAGLLPKLKINE